MKTVKNLECPLCGKKTKTHSGMQSHLSRTHKLSKEECLKMMSKFKNMKTESAVKGQQTYKKRCEDKYGKGITNAFQANSIKDKIKQTNLERYGVENPSQSEEVKTKMKKTWLENYGVDNPAKSLEVQEKIRETNLEKWGCDWIVQSDYFKEKSKETSIKNWGETHPMKSNDGKANLKEKFKEKHGVENPQQVEEIKQKTAETCIEKYGDGIKQYVPRIGQNETQILDSIESKHEIILERQFRVGPYFVDGYDKNNNVVYEVYESYHLKQHEKDVVRMNYIKDKLKCQFIIIEDYK